MRFGLSVAAQPLLVVIAGALPVLPSPAAAACTITGTISFSIACDDFGPNATATESGSVLTVDGMTIDDPDDLSGSYSRIVLKAGSETGGAIDIGVTVTGQTLVDSHNSVGVYLLTSKGDITVDVGSDVTIKARESGIFAKADSGGGSGGALGGNVLVTNRGSIDAGYYTAGSFGSDGIRVRALQGTGTVYNYGDVRSELGRGIRIDGSLLALDPTSVDLDDLVVNYGSVHALLDGVSVSAHTGDATLVNALGGSIVSRSARGAVATSDGAATIENHGSISAATSGALIWGGTDASLINSGTITAAPRDSDDDNDFLNFGAQIWSTASGAASLTNTGSIVAADGWGAWMLTTDGDLTVDNSGTLKGKSTAIYVSGEMLAEQWPGTNPDRAAYAGAQGGDMSVVNSGTITAFETVGSEPNEALISLAGTGLGRSTVTNLAGGFIGAGFADGTDFSASALSARSAAGLDEIQAAAGNKAISMAIVGTGSSITNQGTLVGRVTVASPYDVYGLGSPVSYAGTGMSNSGLWVVSGETGFLTSMSGTTSNTGTIFTLGETLLGGPVSNAGTIWVSPTETEAADLYFSGNYTGTGDASLVFNIKSGALMTGLPLVTFGGHVIGATDVVLGDLDGWDWTTGEDLALIDMAYQTPVQGADAFQLATPIRGLARYGLNYDETDPSWALHAELDEGSVAEVTSVSTTVTSAVADLTSDLLNRTDDLRDMSAGVDVVAPMGYAETPASPVEAAFDTLTPPPGPAVRGWVKADGQLGTGTGFDGRKASFSVGGDVTTEYDAVLYAAGLFGTFSSAALDYSSSGSSVAVGAQAVGAYGLVMHDSGLFTSAMAAVQGADIDMTISGEAAELAALSASGRVDVGYRAQIGKVVVEPSVGYLLGRSGYDDFTLTNNVVSIADVGNSAFEGRLRVQGAIDAGDLNVTPFAILSLGRNFVDGGGVSLSEFGAVGLGAQGGNYGGAAAGLELSSFDQRFNVFARADYNVSEQSRWAAVKLGGSSRF